MELQVRCTYFGEITFKGTNDEIKKKRKEILEFCEELCGSVGRYLFRDEYIYIQENKSIYEYGIRAIQIRDYEEKKQNMIIEEANDSKKKKIENSIPWTLEYIGKNARPKNRTENLGYLLYKYKSVQVLEDPRDLIESMGFIPFTECKLQTYCFSSNMDVEIWVSSNDKGLVFEIVGLLDNESAENLGQEGIVNALKSLDVSFEGKINDMRLKLEST